MACLPFWWQDTFGRDDGQGCRGTNAITPSLSYEHGPELVRAKSLEFPVLCFARVVARMLPRGNICKNHINSYLARLPKYGASPRRDYA